MIRMHKSISHIWVNFSSLSLWSVMKKKPLLTLKNAHHREGSELMSTEENWITAVTALHNTDLIASGKPFQNINLDYLIEAYNFQNICCSCAGKTFQSTFLSV